MRSETVLRLAIVGTALLALSACDTLRREAGMTKQSPDEFAVVTKAPLIIPPDFNLHPPAPGAPPLNQQGPTDSAQTALFNSSDPQTVAAGMGGNLTLGERMLLEKRRSLPGPPARAVSGEQECVAFDALHGLPGRIERGEGACHLVGVV